MTLGRVYILTCSAMPGFVKIGHTTRTVEARIDDLFTTALPVRPEAVFEILIGDGQAALVERHAHDLLRKHRISTNREWFSCSVPEAVSAIRKAAERSTIVLSEIDYVARRKELERQRERDRLEYERKKDIERQNEEARRIAQAELVKAAQIEAKKKELFELKEKKDWGLGQLIFAACIVYLCIKDVWLGPALLVGWIWYLWMDKKEKSARIKELEAELKLR